MKESESYKKLQRVVSDLATVFHYEGAPKAPFNLLMGLGWYLLSVAQQSDYSNGVTPECGFPDEGQVRTGEYLARCEGLLEEASAERVREQVKHGFSRQEDDLVNPSDGGTEEG